MHIIKENIVFFKEFLTEFQTTGSCFPTSRWAAQALTRPIRQSRPPQKILELGPGTGAVTTKILADMIPGDKLCICEINPRFMQALKKKLSTKPVFHKHQTNIDFFLGPMQELPEEHKYDLIVCALPFLNFDLEVVEEIFAKLKRIGHENTIMTYYEYVGIRSIGKQVAPPEVKNRLRKLDSFFADFYTDHEMNRQRIWFNFPPVNIYTLRVAA
jgi:phosphatidylethanolamine/phosphatidyl-N-methylethanolamine N-methyltransferase